METLSSARSWPVPSLDSLPVFPRFEALAAEHKSLLDAVFAAVAPQISELTFAYQWVWRKYTDCRIARCRETILLMGRSPRTGQRYLLGPITPDVDLALEVITVALGMAGELGVDAFVNVPETLAERLADNGALVVCERRDRADYVYRGQDLRELPARRYHGKRNHIKRFWSACPHAQYRELDAALADQCEAFCRSWLARHPKRDSPALQREVDVARAMLRQMQWLGLKGGALVAEGRVAAFALGEAINDETFAIRVEKADTSLPGSYQAINQQFVRHAAADFAWINREQDLGEEGLRRAKLSYHPHHLVKKYEVRLR